MTTDPIDITVVLNTSPRNAFDAFVARINDWWPMERFSVSNGTVMMEQRVGGEIIETSTTGEQHVWGHITAITPGEALDITWFAGGSAKKATQLTVRFLQTDDGRTGVILRHSGWDVLGSSASDERKNYQFGWNSIFSDAFASFAAAHCAPLTHTGDKDV